MTHYIDADELRVEIERRIQKMLPIVGFATTPKGVSMQFAREELKHLLSFLDTLQEPSLPSNLDEAAEEWCKANNKGIALRPDGSHYLAEGMDAFKAGAEWMAGQGATSENVSIDELPVELYQKCVEMGMTSEDKVIVQIRKK